MKISDEDLLFYLSTYMKKRRAWRTYREAAKEAGVDPATFHRIEACGTRPSLDTFLKLKRWIFKWIKN